MILLLLFPTAQLPYLLFSYSPTTVFRLTWPFIMGGVIEAIVGQNALLHACYCVWRNPKDGKPQAEQETLLLLNVHSFALLCKRNWTHWAVLCNGNLFYTWPPFIPIALTVRTGSLLVGQANLTQPPLPLQCPQPDSTFQLHLSVDSMVTTTILFLLWEQGEQEPHSPQCITFNSIWTIIHEILNRTVVYYWRPSIIILGFLGNSSNWKCVTNLNGDRPWRWCLVYWPQEEQPTRKMTSKPNIEIPNSGVHPEEVIDW